jgi:hypothetical protein
LDIWSEKFNRKQHLIVSQENCAKLLDIFSCDEQLKKLQSHSFVVVAKLSPNSSFSWAEFSFNFNFTPPTHPTNHPTTQPTTRESSET